MDKLLPARVGQFRLRQQSNQQIDRGQGRADLVRDVRDGIGKICLFPCQRLLLLTQAYGHLIDLTVEDAQLTL